MMSSCKLHDCWFPCTLTHSTEVIGWLPSAVHCSVNGSSTVTLYRPPNGVSRSSGIAAYKHKIKYYLMHAGRSLKCTLPLVQSVVFGAIQFPLLSHVLVAVRFIAVVFGKHGCIIVCPGCVGGQVSWFVCSSEQFPISKKIKHTSIQLINNSCCSWFMYTHWLNFLLTSYEDDSCNVSHIEASSCSTAVSTTMIRWNAWIC